MPEFKQLSTDPNSCITSLNGLSQSSFEQIKILFKLLQTLNIAAQLKKTGSCRLCQACLQITMNESSPLQRIYEPIGAWHRPKESSVADRSRNCVYWDFRENPGLRITQ